MQKGRPLAEQIEIHKTLNSPKVIARAKSEYYKKVYYADVLDDLTEHVMLRYNRDYGPLENFVNKTLSTIDKSKHEKEVGITENVELKFEKMQITDGKAFGELPTQSRSNSEILTDYADFLQSSNLEDCIKDFERVFITNYMFFKTANQKHRKAYPHDLLELYDLLTIKDAIRVMEELYKEDLNKFYTFKEKAQIKEINGDFLEIVCDPTIIDDRKINQINLVKRMQGCHAKNLFVVDVKDLINRINKLYYRKGLGYMKTTNNEYFLSVSGKIMYSQESVMDQNAMEIVNNILTKSKLKPFDYTSDGRLILSTTKNTVNDIEVNIFGENVILRPRPVPIKEV